MIEKKNLANKLENSIKNFIEKSTIYKCKLNSTYGVDLLILPFNIKCEIKSCNRYIKRHDNSHKSNIRYGNFSFKSKELCLFNNINFYIFIEKKNKMNDLCFISNLKISIVSITDLVNYLFENKKDFAKRIQISVNTLNNIKKINLNKFINLIGNLK